MTMLSQEEVRYLFEYDEITGELTRKVRCGATALEGSKAGADNGNGYLKVTVDYTSYFVHRLVWLYVYGYLPENGIDHVNRIRNDNRLANLREVSQQCNMRNVGNHVHNTSGVKGVCRVRGKNKWRAYIKIDQQQISLGWHDDFSEAVAHRLAAEEAEGWAGCDSNSPAYKYMKRITRGACQ